MKYLNSAALVRIIIYSMWGLILLGCCSWLVVGSVAYFVREQWLPPDTSGWAQAVGGMLAVLVAMVVPFLQNQQLRTQLAKKDHADRLASISAAMALMAHVKKANFEVLIELGGLKLRDPNRNVERQSAAHNAKQAAATLREVPVTAFSTEMVEVIISLREIANYGEYAASALTSFSAMTFDSVSVSTLLNDNLKRLFKIEGELKELSVATKLDAGL